jgi:hypothetical protein
MKKLTQQSMSKVHFGQDGGNDGGDNIIPSIPQIGGTAVIGQQCVYVGPTRCYIADCYGANPDHYMPGTGASGGQTASLGEGDRVFQGLYL